MVGSEFDDSSDSFPRFHNFGKGHSVLLGLDATGLDMPQADRSCGTHAVADPFTVQRPHYCVPETERVAVEPLLVLFVRGRVRCLAICCST